MGFDLGTISAAVTLDDTLYRQGLQRLENSSQATFKNIAGMAAQFLALYKIVRIGQAGAQAFENWETAAWNFDQVFASVLEQASKSEAEMRKLFKLSETTSKNMLSRAADQLMAFGFSAEKALELARKASERGIDIASFKGGNQADAVFSIVSALTGNTMLMKKYGVVINQTNKEYQALLRNIMETTGATALQARAEANLETIIKQTANATGDYLKPGKTLAQQKMDLGEASREAGKALGETFAPALSKVYDYAIALNRYFSSLSLGARQFAASTVALSATLLTLKARFGVSALSGIVGAIGKLEQGMRGVTGTVEAAGYMVTKTGREVYTEVTNSVMVTSNLARVMSGLGAAASAVGTAIAGWEIGKKLAELMKLQEMFTKFFAGSDYSKEYAETGTDSSISNAARAVQLDALRKDAIKQVKDALAYSGQGVAMDDMMTDEDKARKHLDTLKRQSEEMRKQLETSKQEFKTAEEQKAYYKSREELAKRYKATLDEVAKTEDKIAILERQRRLEQTKTAEEQRKQFESEKQEFTELFENDKKKQQSEELNRKYEKSTNKADFAKAQRDKAEAELQKAKAEYERMFSKAQKDNVLTDDEKKELSKARGKISELQNQRNDWESRFYAETQGKKNGGKNLALGSFSAEDLNVAMGRQTQALTLVNVQKIQKEVHEMNMKRKTTYGE